MNSSAQPTSTSVDLDPADPSSQPTDSSQTAPHYPPLPDHTIRPLTSQGRPPQPFADSYAPRLRSSERPYTAHGTSNTVPAFSLGPYMSASAHTSYTRVDLDYMPTEMYPPLPSESVPVVPAIPVIPSSEMTSSNPINATNTGVAVTPGEPAEIPIPQMPQVALTFLLVSGRRKSQSFDPKTTIGRVKELVWNAWPARDASKSLSWTDERPPAPSYLRILYLGKILQDDDTLNGLGFPSSIPSSSSASPTIVHLSIRPYGVPTDDPALSKKRRLSTAFVRRGSSRAVDRSDSGADDADRAGCCAGCVIC
ncbi:hypothetical protein ID866_6409 [Astraeus odoratus]|nr:hypothetical protein ID866_6409 [Astraeus odoratus]